MSTIECECCGVMIKLKPTLGRDGFICEACNTTMDITYVIMALMNKIDSLEREYSSLEYSIQCLERTTVRDFT